MITKPRVYNDISMRGEMDAEIRLLRIMEKENNAHKGTYARSGEITNIGVVFDAPPLALPVHTNTNGKNYKNDDGSLSFVSALLAPPKSRRVDRFYFGSSSSYATNGRDESVS